MAKGISISIASETRDFATGIARGVIEPSQEALEALDRLGGTDAGEQLQHSMQGAQRATEETRADIARLTAQVQQGGRAGQAYGASMKRGMHEADEGVKAARENTASNLKEVAASFDGTLQSGVSGIQGLAAEVLEGFGPAGLIAGAVAAGGLGLILTQIQSNDEQTQAFNADVQALAQSWIEVGKEGKLSTQEVADGLKSLATQSDTQKASLADVEKQAKALGIPFKELAQVYVQGGDATKYALGQTKELIGAERTRYQGLIAAARAGVQGAGAELDASKKRLDSLEQQQTKLRGVQKETTEAAKREREWLAAGGPALERKAQATEDYATNVQSAVHDAGASWDDYATKEGGLSLDKYLAVTRKKLEAVRHYQENLGALANEGNQAALDYVESLGTDAAPLLQKFVDAPAKKRQELVDTWAGLGEAASSSYKSALLDGLPDIHLEPELLPVDSKAYLESVKRAHQAAQAYLKAHPLLGGAVAYTSNGKPIYQ